MVAELKSVKESAAGAVQAVPHYRMCALTCCELLERYWDQAKA